MLSDCGDRGLRPDPPSPTGVNLLPAGWRTINQQPTKQGQWQVGSVEGARLVCQAFSAELKALKERNQAATAAGLQEQRLGISTAEQYPREIQQKRRELLPIMKEAGKETKLIRDKLYINE